MPKKKEVDNLKSEPDDFLDLKPPSIPPLLPSVLLVFSANIPEDAKNKCTIQKSSKKFPQDGDEIVKRNHLINFVKERLEIIAETENALWLNGRLPFITPKQLLLWRLKHYVEHIWAFQLPDNEDLALIFNTTKMRAAHIAADFIARFRKALLFPIALRRIYRILRDQDPNFKIIDRNYDYKHATGSLFQAPARRYIQDTNALIEEFRLRADDFIRDAALIYREGNIIWVGERVIAIAKRDKIREELLKLYGIPKESGYEG